MKNYVEEGHALEFTAPAGGVVSGTGVKIGDLLVIATHDAVAGELFRGQRTGVVDHAKVQAQAWVEGQQVNWDDTLKVFTTATTGKFRAGVAAKAAANPSDTGHVLLHGVNLGAALA
jgi:predicted RecA/RadA family phage recombinase